MKNLLYSLLAAFIAFSRLPIKCQALNTTHFKQAHYFLPLVGAGIGLLMTALFWLSALVFTINTAILLALISGILFTGAIHEDGFADCCDGFGASNNTEKIIAIMKDSRLGTYGVLGLISLMSLKYALFSNLTTSSLITAFINIAVMARLCPLWVMHLTPALNLNSAKMSAHLHNNRYKLALSTIITLAFLLLLNTPQVVAFMLLTLIICSAICSRYFRKKLGGYNGDCLGAAEQMAEIATLAALLMSQYWLF